jgi:hypothetical protein
MNELVRLNASYWWHGLGWSLDQLLTCIRLLIDLGSGKVFRLASTFKSRKRLPSTETDVLLMSATALSAQIRQRQVSASSN